MIFILKIFKVSNILIIINNIISILFLFSLNVYVNGCSQAVPNSEHIKQNRQG